MANRTELFKAIVKTIKLREKSKSDSKPTHSLILSKKQKNATEFTKITKEGVDHVTQLRDFLLKHRKDYIDASGYLASEFSTMSDEERDLIDSAAQDFIKSCSELILRAKKLIEDYGPSQLSESGGRTQCKEHRSIIIELLQTYLKEAENVCQLYSNQKAIRVKRLVERKKVSRLQPERRGNRSLHNRTKHVSLEEERATSQTGSNTGQTSLDTRHLVSSDSSSFEDTLTSEERETFQQENVLMMNHMNSLVDEVRQIESKVIAISKLQETFTEKVLQQAEGITAIHQLTVTSTENVVEGNEEIRSAIRNKGSLRMWILFILVVCSFTLLFLDWYS